MKLIAKGASNREIAEALYITEKTVKNHITRILDQLNLRDRTQAAIIASSLLGIDYVAHIIIVKAPHLTV